MKKVLLMLSVMMTLIFYSQSSYGIMMFEASLDGSQEVPGIVSSASGFASLLLNDAQTRLEINIQLFGLDIGGNQTPADSSDNVTGAHIHGASAGINGPLVFGLFSPNHGSNADLVFNPAAGTIFSAWDETDNNGNDLLSSHLSALMSGGLYINIHTLAFPAGELRGQITAVPEPATILLLGSGLLGLGVFRKKFKK